MGSSALCLLCSSLLTGVILTSAQSGDNSCSSLHHYVELHQNCYIDNFGEPCSGLYCYDDDVYVAIDVNECEDPVSVRVFYDHYDSRTGHFEDFQYLFNQSESVENDGIYSYYDYYDYSGFGDVDTGIFTAIMERNASHLGFELFVEHDDDEGPVWLFYPLYFPLDPQDCMCSSMQNIAEDIDLPSDYDCNTTDAECHEIQCDAIDDTRLETILMVVSPCTGPPSVDLTLVISGESHNLTADGNRTLDLIEGSDLLIIHIWHFNYSMDIEFIVQNDITLLTILDRHKIILDLTDCGPPQPLDISTDSTIPPTHFTEPTVVTDTDPTAEDMCTALKSISILDGDFCITNPACDALECEFSNQRLEMAVDSCHEPPGIRIVLYDSTNHVLYSQGFYNGSTLVHDNRLPFDLNVTVQQLPPSAIIVQIVGETVIGYRIVLVPRTVIPIDKSSCSTVIPTTTAPKSTCSAMQYIQSTVSRLFTLSCYFPHENNCSVLTCPFGDGMDLTVSILRCAHPPAIRITYGNGFFNLFDHTFDHSEVVPIQLQGAPNNTVLNVTLDQLCPSDIGLQIDLESDSWDTTLIPYTVIPINTTGCGPGSGVDCPTGSPTSSSPTGTMPPPTPSFGTDTCQVMEDIADEVNSNPALQGGIKCVLRGCGEIDCNTTHHTAVNMLLHCSPVGVEFVSVDYNPAKPKKYSQLFTESGRFQNLSVTVDELDDDKLGFALAVNISGTKVQLVNYTVIPVGACAEEPTESKDDSGLSTPEMAAVIGAPVLVILVVVVVIVIVTAVYVVRHRRYRHYQLHRMAMSELDEDC